MSISAVSFAPTVGQIREQVMQKLRLDPADSDKALYWINQAYADVAQFSSFDINEKVITITGSKVTLPEEVQMIRQLRRRYLDAPDSRPAQLVRMEEVLTKLSADSTASSPVGSGGVYALSGEHPNELVLWPVAAANEQIVLEYSRLPPQVSDTDRPLIAEPFGSKILEYGALVEGAKFKKDPMVYDYENTHALWVDRYVGWLNRRKTVNSTALEVWVGGIEVDRLEAESERR